MQPELLMDQVIQNNALYASGMKQGRNVLAAELNTIIQANEDPIEAVIQICLKLKITLQENLNG